MWIGEGWFIRRVEFFREGGGGIGKVWGDEKRGS